MKGFQLAVDINDYDLYLDIHHAAVRRNVPDLAHAALIKARAAYSTVGSSGGSRCNSRQSLPTPLHMFSTPDTFLQPVKSATFLKTTSAKKINTHEFKSGEFDEAGPVLGGLVGPVVGSIVGGGGGAGGGGGGGPSLKYESIVALPQSQQSGETQGGPGPVMTTFQPSPYVYRHRQDDQFITHLNTEDFVSSKTRPVGGELLASQVSGLTVSDHQAAHHHLRARDQTGPGTEDIKVIHFGVV